LIDIKLKLNSLNFPEKEILNLAEELKNNYFALTLLKMLIIEHFRFYDVKLPVKQKVCDKLDIPIVKQLNS
ncbi:MAG: hypothetical protein J0M18_15260, partial [Ignavibacteria bacterium]|nr:hypothetical protein [Ignavibacteria bacterium]